MSVDFGRMQKNNEGKTKIIYQNPDDPKTVFMVFKDDITAGDGAKHDIITGKALVDWQTNRDIFEYLNRHGVRTHYISSPEEKVSIVKRLDRKINLEVIARRVATGSILKWSSVKEGFRFDPVGIQFHYKDDPLHDPMLSQDYIDFIIREKGGGEYAGMMELNKKIFVVLEKAFAAFKVQLVDYKLEYGMIDGEVTLIDEITAGSLRLWPYAKDNPNLNQENVLSELNPAGRLDKDVYRMGGDLGTVSSKFAAIASITAKFRDL
jgi:phosphoribosylaminoimidazole-succinocarboxamide synthase